MRFYIVIPFSDEVKAKFSECINRLKNQSLDGKFSPVTALQLSFFSIKETKDIDSIKAAIDAIDFTPFETEIGGYGINNRRTGNVHYSNVKNTPEINALYDAIKAELTTRGVPFDDVEIDLKFTLARDVESIQAFNPGAFSHTVPKVKMTVDTLILQKADYDEGGRLTFTEEYRRSVKPVEEEAPEVKEQPKEEKKPVKKAEASKEEKAEAPKEEKKGFFAKLFGKK